MKAVQAALRRFLWVYRHGTWTPFMAVPVQNDPRFMAHRAIEGEIR